MFVKIGEGMRILDLMHSEIGGWRDDYVAQFFSPDLASNVLSIAIPTHDAQDVRV